MTPLGDAQELVLGAVAPLAAIPVATLRAAGLVTASPLVAAIDVPPFDNSAMDGFAVRAADTAGASPDAPVRLEVLRDVMAGDVAGAEMGPGTAVRIMTGAPVPAGADAIVMVERTTPDGDHVLVHHQAEPGDHVRRAADDVRRGDEVLAVGLELTPARLAVAVSVGAPTLRCHPRPRVGVLSTGDELVPVDQPLRAGQIHDSNRPMLLATLEREGFVPVDLGHAHDDADDLRAAFGRARGECDALITSGGVSMGERDLVRHLLEAEADARWMQIAIKPAKPFVLADWQGMPLFGLPGNPVSSAVSFELLARPALRRMAGHPAGALHRPRRPARAADGLARRPDGKTHFLRVRLHSDEGSLVVRSSGGQGSHQLSALAHADALAVVPDGEGIPAGGTVEVIPL